MNRKKWILTAVAAGVLSGMFAAAAHAEALTVTDMTGREITFEEPVERVVALNPDIVGSAIAFEPYYYPEKGKQFSPYAYRIGNTVDSKQLGSPDYEYHYMD